jgi:hypothetical protein
MPCCGKGRIARPARRNTISTAQPPASTSPVRTQPTRRFSAPVLFQYTGRSGMTVFGPITGLRYRFTAPGSIVAIDARDAPSVAGVPRLQQIGS